MNYYIYIDEHNIARQIVPEYDSHFPDVPIQQRYSSEFISNCIIRSEENLPIINSLYNKETDTFTKIQPIPILPDMTKLKLEKIEELRIICGNNIINKFYSSCTGKLKKYDCELRDQINIQGRAMKAQLILSGQSTDILEYKSSDELICVIYDPLQIMQLAIDLESHIVNNTQQFNLLRKYILEKITNTEELTNITWETEIQIGV